MAGFVLPIISGLAGLFGGGKQQTQTQNSNSTTNSSQQGSQQQQQASSSTPNLSPIQQAMLQQIYAGTTNNLNNATNLNGYTQAGLQSINQGAQAAQQSLNMQNANQGLQFSPAAATSTDLNTLARTGQQAQFQSSIPLLQTQLSQNALQQAMQGFQIQPTGVSNAGVSSGSEAQQGTSNTQGTQTTTTTGNPIAGALGGFGAALAAAPNLFAGIGGFGPTSTTGINYSPDWGG